MRSNEKAFRIADFLRGFYLGSSKKAYLDHSITNADFKLGWDAGIEAREAALKAFETKIKKEKES